VVYKKYLINRRGPENPYWVTWVEWQLLQNTEGTREKIEGSGKYFGK
jgi:hypothetical protein